MHSRYCISCRFIVPSTELLCHTCGGARFAAEHVMAQPVAVASQEDQLQGMLQSTSEFWDELSDTSKKFVRACHTFARLMRGV